MSLLPRQSDQNADADTSLSGRFSRLKPWQLFALFMAALFIVVMFPRASGFFDRKKPAVAATSTNQTGSGEGWKDPAPPAPPPVTPVAMVRPVADTAPPPEVTAKPKPVAVTSSSIGDHRMFGQKATGAPPPAQASPSATHVRGENTGLGQLLKPTELSGYKATRIDKPWATIAEGRIINCTSRTAMTSQLKGFVEAKVADTVLAEDGITPLIERDSTLFGELANTTVQGQTRLFVLWRSVRTPAPNYVRIRLNSPAADELGEAGLEATDIDRHLGQKIWGALLLSGVQIGMQALGAGLQEAISGNRNNGSNNSYSNLNFYQLQGQGSSLASDLLRHQLTIPDTMHRDQAMPCSVFVSGDLVFDDVYALRMRK